MSPPDDVDDKTGLNLLKLLDGEKASHEEKTPRQGSHVFFNPVDFPSDLGSFGNEFWLPKRIFKFGSSFGVGYECLNDQPNLAQELAIAQSLNADMERSLCNLWAENENLKAKCELSSYNSTLLDLNKSKQHEVDLSNMLLKVYKEKTDLTEDLNWVLKKSIPRTLKRVFKSDEFQREVSKLLFMMLEETRHQDPHNDFVPQRVTKAIAGLKSIKWECMNDVIGAPVSLLRYVLSRHGNNSGQGPIELSSCS
ncbi:hypothetical protein Tco_0764070 [Tanacetum coccineum]